MYGNRGNGGSTSLDQAADLVPPIIFGLLLIVAACRLYVHWPRRAAPAIGRGQNSDSFGCCYGLWNRCYAIVCSGARACTSRPTPRSWNGVGSGASGGADGEDKTLSTTSLAAGGDGSVGGKCCSYPAKFWFHILLFIFALCRVVRYALAASPDPLNPDGSHTRTLRTPILIVSCASSCAYITLLLFLEVHWRSILSPAASVGSTGKGRGMLAWLTTWPLFVAINAIFYGVVIFSTYLLIGATSNDAEKWSTTLVDAILVAIAVSYTTHALRLYCRMSQAVQNPKSLLPPMGRRGGGRVGGGGGAASGKAIASGNLYTAGKETTMAGGGGDGRRTTALETFAPPNSGGGLSVSDISNDEDSKRKKKDGASSTKLTAASRMALYEIPPSTALTTTTSVAESGEGGGGAGTASFLKSIVILVPQKGVPIAVGSASVGVPRTSPDLASSIPLLEAMQSSDWDLVPSLALSATAVQAAAATLSGERSPSGDASKRPPKLEGTGKRQLPTSAPAGGLLLDPKRASGTAAASSRRSMHQLEDAAETPAGGDGGAASLTLYAFLSGSELESMAYLQSASSNVLVGGDAATRARLAVALKVFITIMLSSAALLVVRAILSYFVFSGYWAETDSQATFYNGGSDLALYEGPWWYGLFLTWLPDVPPCLGYLLLMWPRDTDDDTAAAAAAEGSSEAEGQPAAADTQRLRAGGQTKKVLPQQLQALSDARERRQYEEVSNAAGGVRHTSMGALFSLLSDGEAAYVAEAVADDTALFLPITVGRGVGGGGGGSPSPLFKSTPAEIDVLHTRKALLFQATAAPVSRLVASLACIEAGMSLTLGEDEEAEDGGRRSLLHGCDDRKGARYRDQAAPSSTFASGVASSQDAEEGEDSLTVAALEQRIRACSAKAVATAAAQGFVAGVLWSLDGAPHRMEDAPLSYYDGDLPLNSDALANRPILSLTAGDGSGGDEQGGSSGSGNGGDLGTTSGTHLPTTTTVSSPPPRSWRRALLLQHAQEARLAEEAAPQRAFRRKWPGRGGEEGAGSSASNQGGASYSGSSGSGNDEGGYLPPSLVDSSASSTAAGVQRMQQSSLPLPQAGISALQLRSEAAAAQEAALAMTASTPQCENERHDECLALALSEHPIAAALMLPDELVRAVALAASAPSSYALQGGARGDTLHLSESSVPPSLGSRSPGDLSSMSFTSAAAAAPLLSSNSSSSSSSSGSLASVLDRRRSLSPHPPLSRKDSPRVLEMMDFNHRGISREGSRVSATAAASAEGGGRGVSPAPTANPLASEAALRSPLVAERLAIACSAANDLLVDASRAAHPAAFAAATASLTTSLRVSLASAGAAATSLSALSSGSLTALSAPLKQAVSLSMALSSSPAPADALSTASAIVADPAILCSLPRGEGGGGFTASTASSASFSPPPAALPPSLTESYRVSLLSFSFSSVALPLKHAVMAHKLSAAAAAVARLHDRSGSNYLLGTGAGSSGIGWGGSTFSLLQFSGSSTKQLYLARSYAAVKHEVQGGAAYSATSAAAAAAASSPNALSSPRMALDWSDLAGRWARFVSRKSNGGIGAPSSSSSSSVDGDLPPYEGGHNSSGYYSHEEHGSNGSSAAPSPAYPSSFLSAPSSHFSVASATATSSYLSTPGRQRALLSKRQQLQQQRPAAAAGSPSMAGMVPFDDGGTVAAVVAALPVRDSLRHFVHSSSSIPSASTFASTLMGGTVSPSLLASSFPATPSSSGLEAYRALIQAQRGGAGGGEEPLANTEGGDLPLSSSSSSSLANAIAASKARSRVSLAGDLATGGAPSSFREEQLQPGATSLASSSNGILHMEGGLDGDESALASLSSSALHPPEHQPFSSLLYARKRPTLHSSATSTLTPAEALAAATASLATAKQRAMQGGGIGAEIGGQARIPFDKRVRDFVASGGGSISSGSAGAGVSAHLPPHGAAAVGSAHSSTWKRHRRLDSTSHLTAVVPPLTAGEVVQAASHKHRMDAVEIAASGAVTQEVSKRAKVIAAATAGGSGGAALLAREARRSMNARAGQAANTVAAEARRAAEQPAAPTPHEAINVLPSRRQASIIQGGGGRIGGTRRAAPKTTTTLGTEVAEAEADGGNAPLLSRVRAATDEELESGSRRRLRNVGSSAFPPKHVRVNSGGIKHKDVLEGTPHYANEDEEEVDYDDDEEEEEEELEEEEEEEEDEEEEEEEEVGGDPHSATGFDKENSAGAGIALPPSSSSSSSANAASARVIRGGSQKTSRRMAKAVEREEIDEDEDYDDEDIPTALLSAAQTGGAAAGSRLGGGGGSGQGSEGLGSTSGRPFPPLVSTMSRVAANEAAASGAMAPPLLSRAFSGPAAMKLQRQKTLERDVAAAANAGAPPVSPSRGRRGIGRRSAAATADAVAVAPATSEQQRYFSPASLQGGRPGNVGSFAESGRSWLNRRSMLSKSLRGTDGGEGGGGPFQVDGSFVAPSAQPYGGDATSVPWVDYAGGGGGASFYQSRGGAAGLPSSATSVAALSVLQAASNAAKAAYDIDEMLTWECYATVSVGVQERVDDSIAALLTELQRIASANEARQRLGNSAEEDAATIAAAIASSQAASARRNVRSLSFDQVTGDVALTASLLLEQEEQQRRDEEARGRRVGGSAAKLGGGVKRASSSALLSGTPPAAAAAAAAADLKGGSHAEAKGTVEEEEGEMGRRNEEGIPSSVNPARHPAAAGAGKDTSSSSSSWWYANPVPAAKSWRYVGHTEPSSLEKMLQLHPDEASMQEGEQQQQQQQYYHQQQQQSTMSPRPSATRGRRRGDEDLAPSLDRSSTAVAMATATAAGVVGSQSNRSAARSRGASVVDALLGGLNSTTARAGSGAAAGSTRPPPLNDYAASDADLSQLLSNGGAGVLSPEAALRQRSDSRGGGDGRLSAAASVSMSANKRGGPRLHSKSDASNWFQGETGGLGSPDQLEYYDGAEENQREVEEADDEQQQFGGGPSTAPPQSTSTTAGTYFNLGVPLPHVCLLKAAKDALMSYGMTSLQAVAVLAHLDTSGAGTPPAGGGSKSGTLVALPWDLAVALHLAPSSDQMQQQQQQEEGEKEVRVASGPDASFLSTQDAAAAAAEAAAAALDLFVSAALSHAVVRVQLRWFDSADERAIMSVGLGVHTGGLPSIKLPDGSILSSSALSLLAAAEAAATPAAVAASSARRSTTPPPLFASTLEQLRLGSDADILPIDGVAMAQSLLGSSEALAAVNSAAALREQVEEPDYIIGSWDIPILTLLKASGATTLNVRASRLVPSSVEAFAAADAAYEIGMLLKEGGGSGSGSGSGSNHAWGFATGGGEAFSGRAKGFGASFSASPAIPFTAAAAQRRATAAASSLASPEQAIKKVLRGMASDPWLGSSSYGTVGTEGGASSLDTSANGLHPAAATAGEESSSFSSSSATSGVNAASLPREEMFGSQGGGEESAAAAAPPTEDTRALTRRPLFPCDRLTTGAHSQFPFATASASSIDPDGGVLTVSVDRVVTMKPGRELFASSCRDILETAEADTAMLRAFMAQVDAQQQRERGVGIGDRQGAGTGAGNKLGSVGDDENALGQEGRDGGLSATAATATPSGDTRKLDWCSYTYRLGMNLHTQVMTSVASPSSVLDETEDGKRKKIAASSSSSGNSSSSSGAASSLTLNAPMLLQHVSVADADCPLALHISAFEATAESAYTALIPRLLVPSILSARERQLHFARLALRQYIRAFQQLQSSSSATASGYSLSPHPPNAFIIMSAVAQRLFSTQSWWPWFARDDEGLRERLSRLHAALAAAPAIVSSTESGTSGGGSRSLSSAQQSRSLLPGGGAASRSSIFSLILPLATRKVEVGGGGSSSSFAASVAGAALLGEGGIESGRMPLLQQESASERHLLLANAHPPGRIKSATASAASAAAAPAAPILGASAGTAKLGPVDVIVTAGAPSSAVARSAVAAASPSSGQTPLPKAASCTSALSAVVSALSPIDGGGDGGFSSLYGSLVSHIEKEEEIRRGIKWLSKRVEDLSDYVQELHAIAEALGCSSGGGGGGGAGPSMLQTFKSSRSRKEHLTRFLPTNLHVQVLSLSGSVAAEATPALSSLQVGREEVGRGQVPSAEVSQSQSPSQSQSTSQSQLVSALQQLSDAAWEGGVARHTTTASAAPPPPTAASSTLVQNEEHPVMTVDHKFTSVAAPAGHTFGFKGGAGITTGISSMLSLASGEALESKRELVRNSALRDLEDAKASLRARADTLVVQAMSAAVATFAGSLEAALTSATTGPTAEACRDLARQLQSLCSIHNCASDAVGPSAEARVIGGLPYSLPQISAAGELVRSSLQAARMAHMSTNEGVLSLRQWCAVGFPIVWESLLSTWAKEKGMLEDLRFACASLGLVNFLLVEEAEGGGGGEGGGLEAVATSLGIPASAARTFGKGYTVATAAAAAASAASSVEPSVMEAGMQGNADGTTPSVVPTLVGSQVCCMNLHTLRQLQKSGTLSTLLGISVEVRASSAPADQQPPPPAQEAPASHQFEDGVVFLLPVRGLRAALELGLLPPELQAVSVARPGVTAATTVAPPSSSPLTGLPPPRQSTLNHLHLPLINVTPILFTQGLNEMQAVARMMSSTSLQDAINRDAVLNLRTYVRHLGRHVANATRSMARAQAVLKLDATESMASAYSLALAVAGAGAEAGDAAAASAAAAPQRGTANGSSLPPQRESGWAGVLLPSFHALCDEAKASHATALTFPVTRLAASPAAIAKYMTTMASPAMGLGMWCDFAERLKRKKTAAATAAAAAAVAAAGTNSMAAAAADTSLEGSGMQQQQQQPMTPGGRKSTRRQTLTHAYMATRQQHQAQQPRHSQQRRREKMALSKSAITNVNALVDWMMPSSSIGLPSPSFWGPAMLGSSGDSAAAAAVGTSLASLTTSQAMALNPHLKETVAASSGAAIVNSLASALQSSSAALALSGSVQGTTAAASSSSSSSSSFSPQPTPSLFSVAPPPSDVAALALSHLELSNDATTTGSTGDSISPPSIVPDVAKPFSRHQLVSLAASLAADSCGCASMLQEDAIAAIALVLRACVHQARRLRSTLPLAYAVRIVEQLPVEVRSIAAMWGQRTRSTSGPGSGSRNSADPGQYSSSSSSPPPTVLLHPRIPVLLGSLFSLRRRVALGPPLAALAAPQQGARNLALKQIEQALSVSALTILPPCAEVGGGGEALRTRLASSLLATLRWYVTGESPQAQLKPSSAAAKARGGGAGVAIPHPPPPLSPVTSGRATAATAAFRAGLATSPVSPLRSLSSTPLPPPAPLLSYSAPRGGLVEGTTTARGGKSAPWGGGGLDGNGPASSAPSLSSSSSSSAAAASNNALLPAAGALDVLAALGSTEPGLGLGAPLTPIELLQSQSGGGGGATTVAAARLSLDARAEEQQKLLKQRQLVGFSGRVVGESGGGEASSSSSSAKASSSALIRSSSSDALRLLATLGGGSSSTASIGRGSTSTLRREATHSGIPTFSRAGLEGGGGGSSSSSTANEAADASNNLGGARAGTPSKADKKNISPGKATPSEVAAVPQQHHNSSAAAETVSRNLLEAEALPTLLYGSDAAVTQLELEALDPALPFFPLPASYGSVEFDEETEPAVVLRLAEDLCRVLRGGRITSCKSSKDRTGMALTLEETRAIAQFEASLLGGVSAALQCVSDTACLDQRLQRLAYLTGAGFFGWKGRGEEGLATASSSSSSGGAFSSSSSSISSLSHWGLNGLNEMLTTTAVLLCRHLIPALSGSIVATYGDDVDPAAAAASALPISLPDLLQLAMELAPSHEGYLLAQATATPILDTSRLHASALAHLIAPPWPTALSSKGLEGAAHTAYMSLACIMYNAHEAPTTGTSFFSHMASISAPLPQSASLPHMRRFLRRDVLPILAAQHTGSPAHSLWQSNGLAAEAAVDEENGDNAVGSHASRTTPPEGGEDAAAARICLRLVCPMTARISAEGASEAVIGDPISMANFMREWGSRLANAHKNTGVDRFAFNALQRSFFPPEYRCPASVMGKAES